MRPIFNKNFIEKKVFVSPINSAQDPLESLKSAGMRFKKKKKK